jgi:hypothetical protein
MRNGGALSVSLLAVPRETFALARLTCIHNAPDAATIRAAFRPCGLISRSEAILA